MQQTPHKTQEPRRSYSLAIGHDRPHSPLPSRAVVGFFGVFLLSSWFSFPPTSPPRASERVYATFSWSRP